MSENVPERKPASGIPARGYQWADFEKGNQVARKHGAYALVTLQPRATEIAAVLRELVPGWQPEFEPAVARLAVCEARIEQAEAAIAEEPNDPDRQYLREELRRWIALALRFYCELAMTPAARARIRKDAGVAAAASVHAQRELEEHLAREYGEVVEAEVRDVEERTS